MAETTIRADGKSSLSHYVDLLVSVPAKLKVLLYRDAEAVRILTATPPLSEAMRRVERWYWDRQREKQTGGIVRTRRIWTRSDERRVNLRLCLAAGCWPECRAARYLSRIRPSCASAFRDAVAQVCREGKFEFAGPKLEAAHEALKKLLTTAYAVTQDEGKESDFQLARAELAESTTELIEWVRFGNSRTADEPQPTYQQLSTEPHANHRDDQHTNDEAKATKPTGGKPATVNERMAGTIMKNRESMGWKSTQWAEHLKCSRSTVTATPTWKNLESARLEVKAKRMKDRHRNLNANNQRRK